MQLHLWITPIVFAIGGLVFGFLLDRLVLRRFRSFASKTPWAWDDVLWRALAGFPLLWSFLAGLHGAIQTAPISQAQLKTGEKILLVLTILSVTVAVARIATGIAAAYSRKGHGEFPSATILANLTRVFVYILGLLTIFYTFGVNITPALTALGIGGIAVALALQDTLSNFFAGLQIIATKQITTGDFIRLNSGDEGYVADITWRYTTLKTLANNIVVIPNSKIASDIFTNLHLPDAQVVVTVQVVVSYDSNLDHVERVTLEVANEIMRDVSGGIADSQAAVRYHTFADTNVQFAVTLRAQDYTDIALIKHEFIKKLHERYRQENIRIPIAVRTVLLQQEIPGE